MLANGEFGRGLSEKRCDFKFVPKTPKPHVQVPYLGFLLTKDGIQLDPSFHPNYAVVAALLTELTKMLDL